MVVSFNSGDLSSNAAKMYIFLSKLLLKRMNINKMEAGLAQPKTVLIEF